MNHQFHLFKKKISNPLAFRIFMLTNLPTAFFAGLKIELFDETKAVISIRQKWFNKNPFHSIYFAVLSMAAEVSTGVLCMGAIYKRDPAVSMLVIKIESIFHKKAIGRIFFTCEDSDAINQTIENAIATESGQTITCKSTGKNEQHEIVAEFLFTWSFKVKKSG